jgi:tight adherence protein B
VVGIPPHALIGALLVFAAVALGTLTLVLLAQWSHERRRMRGVDEQLRRLATEGNTAAAGGSVFRDGAAQLPAWLRPLTARLPHLKDVELRLEQAALTWTVQSYILMSVGMAAALGLGALIAMSSLLYAVPAAVAGALLPHLYVQRRRNKRFQAFEEQLPEAVDLLGRAIRAGHPVSSGFKMVAEEAPDPVAGEFRRVFEEQRFGLAMEDSLLGMADRIPLIDVRIFVTAVLIQREVGGNLAEILDKLSDVIRQRFSVLRQVRTFTAQGRLSGYVLGGLPIGLGLVLFLINPDNMLRFVQAPIGKVMMMVALVLQTLGFLWIRKIIRIEV